MQVREIWNHCFGNDAFCNWFFDKLYAIEYLRVLTVDETVVSMAFCFPREIVSENGVRKAWYLYGIGTHPSARGKGHARALIKACLAEAEIQNVDICFLIPAEQSLFSYYERIGFSKVWTRNVRTGERLLSPMKLETRPVSADEISLLNHLYEIEFPSRVCRSDHDWRLILDEFRLSCGEAVLLYCNGDLIGYAFIYETEDMLHIRELVLCNDVDRIGVCHALCRKKRWELTQFGDGADFAMGYPLTKCGKVSENIYCDLLYN